MKNQVLAVWGSVFMLLAVFGVVKAILPVAPPKVVSKQESTQDMFGLRNVVATQAPVEATRGPASPFGGATPQADSPVAPASTAAPVSTQIPNPTQTVPAAATATPNPVLQATATTAPAPTRPQGGDTKPNGQTWYPPDSNGRIRVDGPCGNPSCIGYWNPAANGGAGGWDPNFPQPGASTPVPKKPSSSGGAGSNPTPTPKPVALSTLLSATPTLGKACKSATSCVDVKITYESNTGLVVKGSTDTPADLSGVSYIEFTVAAKKYRIIVTGGVPQVDARPQ